MKILIAEDDIASGVLLKTILSKYGDCTLAENGKIAFEKFREGFENANRYDLICLDIMMPEMDGQETLVKIREYEKEKDVWGEEGSKILMTTALSDFDNIKTAFKEQCEGYIVKPIERSKVVKELKNIGLI